MATNSPTQRLLDLLPRLSSAASDVGRDAPLYKAFPRVFGTEDGDLLAHHRTFVRILKLIEDSRREVFLAYYDDGVPDSDQTDTVRSAMSPLEPIRSVMLNNSVHSKAAIVQSFPISDLHLLNNSLRRFFRAASPQEDAVEKAKQLIARANTTVGGAGLPPEVVAAFHEGTARVLRSLESYETFGPDETIESVGQVMALSISLTSQVPAEKQSVWREALSLVADVAGVVQVAWPLITPVLATIAMRLLGP